MRLCTRRAITRSVLLVTVALLLSGCSGGDTSDDAATADGTSDAGEGAGASGGQQTAGAGSTDGDDAVLTQALIAQRIFDPSVSRFVVHVFHEAGAEPYTGRLGLSANDTWDITLESYRDLFAAHAGRLVSVPTSLEQMQGFEDQGIQNRGIAELVALGESLAPALRTGSEANMTIVFVNGLYDGNDRVLGIHPTDSPFAFVFKDVVRSVGGDATTQRYVEQATIVHELGHAIGFVDNGVPMVNAHQDTEHPHHTLNSDGVMYWAVESKSGALSFVTELITGSRLGLFGSESLLDAHNYMPDTQGGS